MNLLDSILKLLPVIGPVAATLPEFKALVDTIKGSLNSEDQATLKDAYALAIRRSDQAHAELQKILNDRLG